jgi:hypothetical protein
MSDRRTLEELKLLLQGSYAAESNLAERINRRYWKSIFADTDEARKMGLGPREIEDYSSDKTKRLKRSNYSLSPHDSQTYKKSFLEKRRRKIIADELRAVRKEIPDPKQARAALYDILRTDASVAKRAGSDAWGDGTQEFIESKNPFKSLISEAKRAGESVVDDEVYRRQLFMEGIDDDYLARSSPEDQRRYKEMFERASEKGVLKEIKEGRDKDLTDRYNRNRRRNLLDIFDAEKNKPFPKRHLRRASLGDLKQLLLLSLGDFNQEAAKSVVNEISQRGTDELNRKMSRRNVMKRTAAQAIKPSLPKSIPGTGGAGEQVAKTLLRLITRGRGI